MADRDITVHDAECGWSQKSLREKIMLNLDQDKFITDYVTIFLATWTANEYDSACQRGEQRKLNNPPIEDAVYLARMAWMKMVQLGMPGIREYRNSQMWSGSE
jgi:hypothetical protein